MARNPFAWLRRRFDEARVTLLFLAAAVALAWLGAPTSAVEKEKARGDAAASGPLGRGQTIAARGVREPSGVAFHPGRGTLFVVGDEGTLAEMDLRGQPRGQRTLGQNLEEVVVLPSGDLLLLDERSASLMLYDPDAGQERRRWSLDAAALLGEDVRAGSNRGFEGLAFREEPGSAGKGGRLYLVHQSRPTTVVVLAFDPKGTAEQLAPESVVARWPLERYENVTGAAYVAALGRLLLIAERADRLLVVTGEGRVEKEIPLPGVQQEGICVDGEGALWVADDRAGTLVRFPGALQILRKQVGGVSNAGSPPGEEQP